MPTVAAVNMALSTAADGYVLCLQSSGGSIVWWSSSVDLTVGGTIAGEIRGFGAFTSGCTGTGGLIAGGCGSAGQTQIGEDAANGVFVLNNSASTHSGVISNIQFNADAFHTVSTNGGFIYAGTVATPYIIHHNDFIFTGNTGGNCFGYMIWAVPGTNGINGVIYRNRFLTTGQMVSPCFGNTNVNAIQNQNGDSGAGWASASTFGSADTGNSSLYVEQNYFDNFNVATDWHTGNVRAVWRFNELHNASLASHGYDSGSGPRAMEAYGNHFYCDEVFDIAGYIGFRGGTGFIWGNTFDPLNSGTMCATSSTPDPVSFQQDKTFECTAIGGWPGSGSGTPPVNYPIPHQVGWGWVTGGAHTAYGTSSAENLPGLLGYPTDGWQQDLEPWYVANNTNNTGNTPTLSIDSGRPGTCRAMAYSNQSKAAGTSLSISLATMPTGYPVPFANVGQQAVAVFADVLGGSAPTITSSPLAATLCTGGAWTPLNGGTSGSTRLSAWTCNIAVDGQFSVTFSASGGTSGNARAGTVLVMRGMTASPTDQNPAVATVSSSPYTANSLTPGNAGFGNTANEIVIGYFALPVSGSDALAPGSSDTQTMSCQACGALEIGTNGTTGGSDVTVATTYRVVSSNSPVTVQQVDATNPSATVLAGAVSFKVNGSTATPDLNATPLDMQSNQFIAYNREAYDDWVGTHGNMVGFNGTSGVGTGTKATLTGSSYWTSCTNGVGFWVTDEGSWNTTSYNSGKNGRLYTCKSNVWSVSYTPSTMPHPLDNVSGGGPSMFFSQQPTDVISGTNFNPNIVITISGTTAVNSIQLQPVVFCNFSLTGTTTVNSTGGSPNTATFTGVGVSAMFIPSSNCSVTASDITDPSVIGATSALFNITGGTHALVGPSGLVGPGGVLVGKGK